jgi:hypothetical protein
MQKDHTGAPEKGKAVINLSNVIPKVLKLGAASQSELVDVMGTSASGIWSSVQLVLEA